MENRLLYIIFWPLLLFLAASVFTFDVVLGTFRLTTVEAAIYAGIWITFLAWIIRDFVEARGIDLSKKIVAIAVLWFANSAAVWIVARFAYITGLGISSFHWALLLGLVAAFAQEIIGTCAKKAIKGRK